MPSTEPRSASPQDSESFVKAVKKHGLIILPDVEPAGRNRLGASRRHGPNIGRVRMERQNMAKAETDNVVLDPCRAFQGGSGRKDCAAYWIVMLDIGRLI